LSEDALERIGGTVINTAGKTPLSREAREAISNYLRRRDGSRLVSAHDAIVHFRECFPSFTSTDELIADTVAGEAIILGLRVELDKARGTTRPLFDRWTAGAGRMAGP